YEKKALDKRRKQANGVVENQEEDDHGRENAGGIAHFVDEDEHRNIGADNLVSAHEQNETSDAAQTGVDKTADDDTPAGFAGANVVTADDQRHRYCQNQG